MGFFVFACVLNAWYSYRSCKSNQLASVCVCIHKLACFGLSRTDRSTHFWLCRLTLLLLAPPFLFVFLAWLTRRLRCVVLSACYASSCVCVFVCLSLLSGQAWVPQRPRPRRNRKSEAMRSMVRENVVRPSNFIYPLFIHEEVRDKRKGRQHDGRLVMRHCRYSSSESGRRRRFSRRRPSQKNGAKRDCE